MQSETTCRRLSGLVYFCAYAGRTFPRGDHMVSQSRVRPRKPATVAEEANQNSAFRRGKGLETQIAHGVPVCWQHDYGYPTYWYSLVFVAQSLFFYAPTSSRVFNILTNHHTVPFTGAIFADDSEVHMGGHCSFAENSAESMGGK